MLGWLKTRSDHPQPGFNIGLDQLKSHALLARNKGQIVLAAMSALGTGKAMGFVVMGESPVLTSNRCRVYTHPARVGVCQNPSGGVMSINGDYSSIDDLESSR
jgi:hypothetical protein